MGTETGTAVANGSEDGQEVGGSSRAWIGRAVFVAAICLAAYLVHRLASQYDPDDVMASVASFPTTRLLLAMACAAASYLCLTGFDTLALRYVEKPLSYPRTALASFVSLSIGHNVGMAALSTGAIRYRFYTRWGLTGEEVAKVVLFCGITVGLGLMVLGGAALLLRPGLAQEITRLDQAAVIAIGAACLGLAAAYVGLAAFLRHPLRFRKWTLEMPPLPLAIGQVVIGPINFAFVAACLHQTIAAVGDVPYLSVAATYVIANVTALISHVPGGLGVIEGVVVFLLPQADLIGAVLVFRVVYFLVPLSIGVPMFLLSELVVKRRNRTASGAGATPAAAPEKP